MKRGLVSIILVLSMVAVLLAGCGSSSNPPAEGGKTQGTDQNAGGQKQEEKITITFASWNLGTAEENNIERQMIKAFEESHPNIKIQPAENVDYSKYGDSLTALASAGKLPDAFMLNTIPWGIENEWLLNIKEYASKDPEWANIPKPLEQATHVGDGIYAIPTGMYFMGYFVNDDLFAQANVPSLSFAPSWDDFIKAVKTMNKPQEGIIGLAEEVQIPDYYPAQVNPKLGWYTWDGQAYHLDDPAFIDAVKKAKELFQGKYVYDSLTDQQKAKYNAKWYGDVWNQGKIAIRWDGTWAVRDYSKLNFKFRFIGVPGNRIPVVGDYIGISKATKYPEQVYEFVKFMTFAKEGILKRMELNKDGSYTSLPLTTDQTILDQYFAQTPYEGLKEAYEQVANGIVEGVKVVPGYVNSRWTAPTGIKAQGKDNANIGDVIWDTMRGTTKIEDYAAQLNKLANDEYQKAAQNIKELAK